MYFTEKVAAIGHYNLVSIQYFCRNSLFWTNLVKIFSLRCTANCSVLYGELPKDDIRTVRQLAVIINKILPLSILMGSSTFGFNCFSFFSDKTV